MKTIHFSAISNGQSLRIGVETEGPTHSPLCNYVEKNIEADHLERIKNECLHTINQLNIKTHKKSGLRQRLESLGAMLSQELLPPATKLELMRTESHFLILHIDDNLVHIPWELILIGNQFLCERFNIGRLVNTHQKVIDQPIEHDRALPINMSILVNPDGDLENADEESEQLIESMDQLNDDQKKLIIDASSYGHFSLKDTLSLIRQSDFLHFAGHAVYHCENSKKSGWKLGNDYLTAVDIKKMFGFSMPVLIFSNACQSARTNEWKQKESKKDDSVLLNDSTEIIKPIEPEKNKDRSASSERFVKSQMSELETFDLEENFGLVNAFLHAGVKFYIGTNWKILDEPGSRFAIYFYTSFLSGLSIGESINKARLSCIEKYGPDSIDWASYVLYGDPRFSLNMYAKTSDVVKERRVDAIAPDYAEINNQIDLIIQVRLFDSPVLSFEDIPIKHKPHSVTQGSETIELEFPVKPDGQIESTCIKIKVTTIHFTITNGNEKSLKIPPNKDSKRVFFYLIAKQVGNCRINIEFSSYDKTYLGSIPIEINVSDQPSLDIVPLTLNSFSFIFRMADKNVNYIGSYLYEKVPDTFRFDKKLSNEQIVESSAPVTRSNQKTLYRDGQNWLLNEIKHLNLNIKWVTGLTGLMLLFIIFFSIIEIMLHPPQSFDDNQICNNEEIQQELLDNMIAFKTDRLKNINVACDTSSSVTGVSIKFDSKSFVDSGHHAIRKVILDSSIETIAGGDKAENFEVVFNNNSVGSQAPGISNFSDISNDTSLSLWNDVTIPISWQAISHGGQYPYVWAAPSNISSNNCYYLSSGLEYTHNSIHGSPKMSEMSKSDFIGIKTRTLGVDFDSKFVDSGNHAIRRVDSSDKTIVGADKTENFEVELNNNSVETGAEAFVISKFVATSDDTSLSSSKPEAISLIWQVFSVSNYDLYRCSRASLGLVEYTNNNIHGTPEMSEVEFIDMKPFEGINNPVGAGARALGITSYVGRYVAIADDATAASWKPGGLNLVRQVEYNHIFNMSGSFRSNTTWNVAGKSLGFEYTHINNQEIVDEFKLVTQAFDLYSKRPFSLNKQYRSNLEKTLKLISENIQQFENAYGLNIKPIFNHKWRYNFTKNRWEFHSRFKYTFN